MTKNLISVTVLTKNSEKLIEQVLESLKDFHEVIILDNGSSDSTLEIAKTFANVQVYTSAFIGFGPLHNLATSHASQDWVLSIDSDEVLSKDLAQELLTTPLDSSCIYSFPRHTYYRGKLIKWCGWYPDRICRLYNRTRACFSNDFVHEKVLPNSLQEVQLRNPVIHYSYTSVTDFLAKMQTYSELFAQQNRGKKASSLFKAITHGLFGFFKSYLIKRGFMGGYEGFLISAYNGHTAFYKYLKLYEANQSETT
jgi:glycosyltransferase involved in cell wall biosynthesis